MNRRLIALLVGALALRLAVAPQPSYWVDEAFTVDLLSGGVGDLLADLPDRESTPPLYYLLAWGWTQLAGLGELGLRSLSALAGTATVGCAWALGRRLRCERTALAAGALTAVNPFLVWFSTEARAYALATALTTGALVLLLDIVRRPDTRAIGGGAASVAPSSTGAPRRAGPARLVAWAALSCAALLAHYATVFVVAAQAAMLLWRVRSRASAAAVGAVTAVGAALVPLAIAQRGNEHAQALDEMSGPLLERVARLPKQFAIGYDAPVEAVAAALALAVLAVGLAGAALQVRRGGLAAAGAQPIVLTLGIAFAGLALPVAVALVGPDAVASRYLLPALPPLIAVAGTGLVAGPWRRLGPALAVALYAGWLAVTIAVAADPRLQTRADWQGVEAALGPAPAGGRAIVATPSNGALVLLDAYRLDAAPGPARPVAEVVLATTAEPGDAPPAPADAPPAPSGEGAPPLVAAGFDLVEQRRERAFALQRWRAPTPRPLDPGLLLQSSLDPTRPAALLWQSPDRE